MSKSAREWFEELPEPYRTDAVIHSTREALAETYESLALAIFYAVDWDKRVWAGVYRKVVNGEPLEVAPDLRALVREYFAVIDGPIPAFVDDRGEYDLKLDAAEKALREAVGL